MSSGVEETPLINVLECSDRKRYEFIRRWTPVELLVILHTMAVVSLGPVQTYYIIDKIAQKHGQSHIIKHTEDSCNHTHTNTSIHHNDTSNIIQKESTELIMYLGMCSTFGSVIPIFFIGYMSDLFGRKLMWIVSISGTMFKELMLLLTVVLNWPVWVLYISQLVFAFTGTYGGAMSQIFATVSDITLPDKDRAFRITVVQATGMLTAAVTTFFMGYWIKTEDFYQPLCMAFALSVVSLAFGAYILKSPPDNSKTKTSKNPLKAFKLYCKDNAQHRRRKLWTCLLVFILSSFNLIGKLEYQTLFLMHTPICWTAFDIQVMHAVQTLVNTFCVVAMVKLMLWLTQDSVVLICGSISGIVSVVILGFSVNTTMVYLHVLFGFISISVFPVARGMMSRLVDPNEQGFLFASIAGIDELSAALSGVVFGKLYKSTLDHFPGLIFLVMAGIFCIALIGSLLLHRWMRTK